MKDVVDELLEHIVSVFVCGSNKRPELIGTGFFYNYKGLIYLVSASHVFVEVRQAKSPIYVGVKDKIIRLIQSPTYRTACPNNEIDHIDLMASPVSNENEYFNYIQSMALEFPEEAYQKGSSDGKLLVQGYPVSKNKPVKANDIHELKTKVTPFSKQVSLNENINLLELGKDPKTHYPLTWTFDKKIQGEPSPKGLSGGPLWLLREIGSPLLIGVFIEYHKNINVAFATKIHKLNELIENKIASFSGQ